MALFCTSLRRDPVSLLSFPILSHIEVFSCEISLVCRLTSSQFLPLVLTGGSSQKYKWQQVSSDLLVSSEFSV